MAKILSCSILWFLALGELKCPLSLWKRQLASKALWHDETGKNNSSQLVSTAMA